MTGLVPPPEAVDRFRSDLLALTGESPTGLGVAVSGGSDSLALLLLAQAAFPAAVRAATVDHLLRPEAADEAAFVASVCVRLGVDHETLRPERPITGNLQSAARDARYRLLDDWRRRHGLDRIATAHHADDQAETLLMRLNRGSGVAGLSGIRSVNLSIVRPLLRWRRKELEAIVAAAGIAPVFDSSNLDERFDRVRIRNALRDSPWIDPLALARSAAAISEAEAALSWVSDWLWAERASRSGSSLRLDISQLPAELRRRLVRRALAQLAPDSSVRGEDLGRFIVALETGGVATLAGVSGKSGGDYWHFTLAPPRRR